MRLDIRYGRPVERLELEGIQRRASLKWIEYRAKLWASPDAIQLPMFQLENNCVRVAELNSSPMGFSIVVPGKPPGVSELDGLFVEPDHWYCGIGRALLIDAVKLARWQGAHTLEVIANPLAKGFYERCGLVEYGQSETRFGPAFCMRYSIPE